MTKTSLKREGSLDLAIIGGGITGICLALGLLSRNIHVTVYERAVGFGEIGAGIGFTANAERAMMELDPRIHAAFKSVAVQNTTDWFQWMDGFSQTEDKPDEMKTELLFKMYLGERGFEGCHRAQLLDELVKLMADGHVKFNKYLETIDDGCDGEKLRLKFYDGTTEEADAGERQM
jgi:salicylate hydroxylase